MQYRDFGKMDFKVFHRAMGSMSLLFVNKNYGNGVINYEVSSAIQHNRVVQNVSP